MPATPRRSHGTLHAAPVGEREWVARAACSAPGVDPEWFFPSSRGVLALAVDVCTSCPVREVCREDATTRGERSGVWGGRQFGSSRPIAVERESSALFVRLQLRLVRAMMRVRTARGDDVWMTTRDLTLCIAAEYRAHPQTNAHTLASALEREGLAVSEPRTRAGRDDTRVWRLSPAGVARARQHGFDAPVATPVDSPVEVRDLVPAY